MALGGGRAAGAWPGPGARRGHRFLHAAGAAAGDHVRRAGRVLEPGRRLPGADLLRPCRVRGRGRLYHLAAAASPEAHAVAGHPAGRADQRGPGLAGGRADAAPVGPLLRHGHHRAAPDRPAADDQLGLGGRRRGAGGPDRRRDLDAAVPQQGAVLLDRRGPGVPDVLRHVLPGAFEDRLLLARHQRRRGRRASAWAWPPTATRCWPSCCRPA